MNRLHCPDCGTEVAGEFTLTGLAMLPEPHASLIQLFLRVRGNVKEMERELGLSYPTVRGRLEEALAAAGVDRDLQQEHGSEGSRVAAQVGRGDLSEQRLVILRQLERGEMSSQEASRRIRELQGRR